MPARVWPGQEPEASPDAPRVIVSSADNAPVPYVAGACRLAELALSNGWAARQTYALCNVPARLFKSGRVAKPEHRLATVAVRMRRGDAFVFGVWASVDHGRWSFSGAWSWKYGQMTLLQVRRLISSEGER
jgi:hypothetical protein